MNGALPGARIVRCDLFRMCRRCLLLSERAFFTRRICAMRCPVAVRGVVAALCSGDLRQLVRLV